MRKFQPRRMIVQQIADVASTAECFDAHRPDRRRSAHAAVVWAPLLIQSIDGIFTDEGSELVAGQSTARAMRAFWRNLYLFIMSILF